MSLCVCEWLRLEDHYRALVVGQDPLPPPPPPYFWPSHFSQLTRLCFNWGGLYVSNWKLHTQKNRRGKVHLTLRNQAAKQHKAKNSLCGHFYLKLQSTVTCIPLRDYGEAFSSVTISIIYDGQRLRLFGTVKSPMALTSEVWIQWISRLSRHHWTWYWREWNKCE